MHPCHVVVLCDVASSLTSPLPTACSHWHRPAPMVTLPHIVAARETVASGLAKAAERVTDGMTEGTPTEAAQLLHLVANYSVTVEMASAYLQLASSLPSNKSVDQLGDEDIWTAILSLDHNDDRFTCVVTTETTHCPMFGKEIVTKHSSVTQKQASTYKQIGKYLTGEARHQLWLLQRITASGAGAAPRPAAQSPMPRRASSSA